MKLAEATALSNENASRSGAAFEVGLWCGFSVLHLKTFLEALLAQRFRESKIVIQIGTYGDLVGNLERARPSTGLGVNGGRTARLAQPSAPSVHTSTSSLDVPSVHPERSRGAPHRHLVLIEWEDLDPRLGLRSAAPWSASALPDIVRSCGERLRLMRGSIEQLAQGAGCVVGLPSLPLPPIFRNARAGANPVALALEEKVLSFASALSSVPNVSVLSPQRLDELSPPAGRGDAAAELRWGFPYSLEHTAVLAQLLCELLAPPSPKKGLITDLDGTVWHGILGEDGVENLSWHLERGSHSHALYQKLLASLAESGTLIGVASKNDPARVKTALERKDLLLSSAQLFPVEAGWGPKSEAVARILRAWNISASNVVFVDDSPLEVAEVRQAFGELEAFVFPPGDREVVALLSTLRDRFARSSTNEEDRLRAPSLQAAQLRSADEQRSGLEAVLGAAGAAISLKTQPDARTLELINKTNQFNLSGRRIDDAEWKARLADPQRFTLIASYQDKYGPLGQIAAISGTRRPAPRVDTWVLSCRAFSRRIEHVMLEQLFERLKCAELELDWVETDRNVPLREFINSFGSQNPRLLTRDAFKNKCPKLYAEVKIDD